MKWAILIPTIPARGRLFGELSARIANQIIHRSDVICIVHVAEPNPDVAGIRNSLLDQARHAGAEYFSFVDDDDLVSLDYVRSILPLLDGVDTVQFNTAYYARGIFRWIEERGLQYHGVYVDRGRRFRDISHLSATRVDLALPFRQAPSDGFEPHCEDTRWADDMRAARRLQTEHIIPRVLYHYFYREPAVPAEPLQAVTMRKCIVGTLPGGHEFCYDTGQKVMTSAQQARDWEASGVAMAVSNAGLEFIASDSDVTKRVRGFSEGVHWQEEGVCETA